ncbi:ArsR family transcriptional regulator [Natronosalvus amylolyticus]|uniref:ArsR family transcriptional regulator n=1 Tax=Natronosalvus amylolyticus TaxID=2961994 RepID=UPI0020C9822C|nr:ArsR family transcriptional regulator [Natronosalvus amylolyticus]
MTKRSRDSKGRFDSSAAYSDQEFIDAVGELDLPTTVDVANVVGCGHSTAHGRLKSLEDSGDLESRSVGSALVWSVT